jgi:hypothetical protein
MKRLGDMYLYDFIDWFIIMLQVIGTIVDMSYYSGSALASLIMVRLLVVILCLGNLNQNKRIRTLIDERDAARANAKVSP